MINDTTTTSPTARQFLVPLMIILSGSRPFDPLLPNPVHRLRFPVSFESPTYRILG
jgi:hypothetical protein